jgi:hypothetical protein
MSGYAFLNKKLPTYNYERVWFWNLLAHFAVIWIALLTILNQLTNDNLIWVVCLFAGWGVILVIGIVV